MKFIPQKKTRCFISLALPQTILQEMLNIQNLLKKKNLFKGKYTNKTNIHLTLKFLGETEPGQIKEIDRVLQNVEFMPLNVRLGDIGVFSRRHVRIIWAHLEGVNDLQSRIDRSLEPFFEPEARFMSHITIARVKKLPDKTALLQTIDNIACPNIEETIHCFSLKKSTLTPKGPIYDTINSYYAK